MKWTLFLFIFILVSCAQLGLRGPAGKTPERHIVFDIDWTIVSEIKNPTPVILKNPRVIDVHGSYYFVNEGLEEFMADILSHPEIRISFYSGGKAVRNQELLSKIKLKNGKSLLEISYKVLGSDELVLVEALPGARFAERFKKDLTKISKDLDQLIMLDDTMNFVVDSSDNQNEHVFFIGKAFEYFENFKDAEGMSGEYIPHTYDEWFLNRKKLNVLNAVFKEAYAESVESGISFSEAMKKREVMLNLNDNEWNSYVSSYYKKFQNIKIPKTTGAEMECRHIAKLLMGR